MVTLKLKSNYRNDARGLAFKKGQIVEIENELAAWLQRDAPEAFEVVVKKAPDAPPVDKAVKGAGVKK